MKIGLLAFVIDSTANPAAVAHKAEALGFESLWLPEHPRKSAGCTIATSALRPDGTNYCLPLVARQPVPHGLRILVLIAFRFGSGDSRLWYNLRASVHHGWSPLAPAPVPIFVGRELSAGTG